MHADPLTELVLHNDSMYRASERAGLLPHSFCVAFQEDADLERLPGMPRLAFFFFYFFFSQRN